MNLQANRALQHHKSLFEIKKIQAVYVFSDFFKQVGALKDGNGKQQQNGSFRLGVSSHRKC